MPECLGNGLLRLIGTRNMITPRQTKRTIVRRLSVDGETTDVKVVETYLRGRLIYFEPIIDGKTVVLTEPLKDGGDFLSAKWRTA